jgi:hypothetical protein
MLKGFKKITSRWRSHNGSLSQCKRHRCIRSSRKRPNRPKKLLKKRNNSETCKRRRCRLMEKSSERISNPRFPRNFGANFCKESQKADRRRRGCVRSGSRGTRTTYLNRGGPASSPQPLWMRVVPQVGVGSHPRPINRLL